MSTNQLTQYTAQLWLGRYDPTTVSQRLLVSLMKWADNFSFTFGENGDDSATIIAYIGLSRSFENYSRDGLLWLTFEHRGRVVWSGRVDQFSVSGVGTTITAFGLWKYIDDEVYTKVFSFSGFANWLTLNKNNTIYLAAAAINEDLFNIDNNNRCFIGLKQGMTYDAAVTSGGLLWKAPVNSDVVSSASVQSINQFSYEVMLPTTFTVQFVITNSAGARSVVWTSSGTGAVVTGAFLGQTGQGDALEFCFSVYNSSGAPVGPYSPNDNTNYIKITNFRYVNDFSLWVDTTTTAVIAAGSNVTIPIVSSTNLYVGQQVVLNTSVVPSEVSVITSVNSPTSITVATLVNGQASGVRVRAIALFGSTVIRQLITRLTTNIPNTVINSSLASITSSVGISDLFDLAAIDERLSTLIRRIALGDRYRVWINRLTLAIVYEPDVPVDTWVIDATSINVVRDGSSVENSVYSTYASQAPFPSRTAPQLNQPSVTHFGFRRRGVLDSNTSSATLAASRAATEVVIRSNPPPKVTFKFKRFSTVFGGPVDGEQPTNGDLIKLRNLPVTLTAGADQLRYFVLRRVTIAGQRGTPGVSVSIETSRPSDDTLRTLASLDTRFLNKAVTTEPRRS